MLLYSHKLTQRSQHQLSLQKNVNKRRKMRGLLTTKLCKLIKTSSRIITVAMKTSKTDSSKRRVFPKMILIQLNPHTQHSSKEKKKLGLTTTRLFKPSRRFKRLMKTSSDTQRRDLLKMIPIQLPQLRMLKRLQ